MSLMLSTPNKLKDFLMSLISRWHVGVGKNVPPRHTVDAMAQAISEVIADRIPTWAMAECWRVAMQSTEWMPQGSNLIKAWETDVKQRPRESNEGEKYRPNTHSCQFCSVVALRVRKSVPDATQWEIDTANAEVTQKELDCVKSTVLEKPYLVKFWRYNSASPYRGMF
jgi:hypothetical protein